MSLKTPLRRARGLGAAKEGVGHFIAQRATAIALVPLVIWFLGSLVLYGGADHASARAYLSQPLVSVLMALLIFTGFYHMKLGLQVVIEDYISREGSRLALLLLMNFATFAVGFACIFAVLRLSFGAS